MQNGRRLITLCDGSSTGVTCCEKLRVLMVGGKFASRSDLEALTGHFEPRWHISVVTTGTAGLEVALSPDCRVVVVDSSLEGEPKALDLVRAVRHARRDATLLVLVHTHDSAEDYARIVADAAEAGAHGYIVAELGPAEFRARILFASRCAERTEVIRCAELEIDMVSQEARVGKSILDLTKTQWRLLVRMALCKGMPVPNAELCQFARIQRDLEWVNLRDAVRHLRARLGSAAYLVRSFRRRGYGLAPDSDPVTPCSR